MTSWTSVAVSGLLALGALPAVAPAAVPPATAPGPAASVPAATVPAAAPAPAVAPAPAAGITIPAAPLHGCPIPDLSGTGGCLTPAMGLLMVHVIGAFGELPVSCWNPRDGDPWSDHPKGRACDYTMGRIGSYAGGADVARGWSLATWLRANAVPLHVNYVFWQGRIWSRAYDAAGWRPYTGGGHYPTSGPTYGHYDHVHVSTLD